MKRSRYNLLPYFIDDERSLAKRRAYVASCERFFRELKNLKLARLTAANVQEARTRDQASSDKLQAASLNSNTIK